MAEALKTFREGEDILASETNENNQYLLSRLSDNAAQVQQYVEGEVATIKSNVASVQATLQNNIDETKASLNDLLSNICKYFTPDYTKGTSVPVPYSGSPFTAPSNGVYLFTGGYNEVTRILYINGKASGYVTRDDVDGYAGWQAVYVPLMKGDVIYWNGAMSSYASMFYPYRAEIGE
jgi:hypothetical protein